MRATHGFRVFIDEFSWVGGERHLRLKETRRSCNEHYVELRSTKAAFAEVWKLDRLPDLTDAWPLAADPVFAP